MRRWSFKDIYGEGFRVFPGTLHWTSPTRLKNDTGQTLRDGVYLDSKAGKKYLIPVISPGEEIDLASMIPEGIDPKRGVPVVGIQVFNPGMRRPRNKPFLAEELLYSGSVFPPAEHIFAGVIEPAKINARLEAEGTSGRTLALAIVFLDQP
jgi:hypothetical protein